MRGAFLHALAVLRGVRVVAWRASRGAHLIVRRVGILRIIAAIRRHQIDRRELGLKP